MKKNLNSLKIVQDGSVKGIVPHLIKHKDELKAELKSLKTQLKDSKKLIEKSDKDKVESINRRSGLINLIDKAAKNAEEK